VRFQADSAAPLRVWDRVEGDLVERRVDEQRATSRVLGLDLVVVGRALRLERDGVVVPTPSERAAREAERAAVEAERAGRLRAKLVAAGIDPED
jgi:7,8-dihydro-6-hydroxymethylpterin-pyrophosphokinase